jgi:hypothetical protein
VLRFRDMVVQYTFTVGFLVSWNLARIAEILLGREGGNYQERYEKHNSDGSRYIYILVGGVILGSLFGEVTRWLIKVWFML